MNTKKKRKVIIPEKCLSNNWWCCAIFLALKSSKSNGQIYNLGSGKGITIRVLVNQIRKIIGGGKPKFGSYKNLRQFSYLTHSRYLI